MACGSCTGSQLSAVGSHRRPHLMLRPLVLPAPRLFSNGAICELMESVALRYLMNLDVLSPSELRQITEVPLSLPLPPPLFSFFECYHCLSLLCRP